MTDDEARARLESAAQRYEEAAAELDLAAAHLRRAAEHFRGRDVPRGTAHAWAGRGHMLDTQERLDELAREHAQRSTV